MSLIVQKQFPMELQGREFVKKNCTLLHGDNCTLLIIAKQIHEIINQHIMEPVAIDTPLK